MKICSKCKTEKELPEFGKNSARKDGLQTECKECKRSGNKAYYAENQKKMSAQIFEAKQIRAAASRQKLFEYLSTNACVDCGNSDIRVLEFDHVRGTKVAGVGKLVADGYAWETILEEIDKCEVRCKNCHQIKTFERAGGSWHDQFCLVSSVG